MMDKETIYQNIQKVEREASEKQNKSESKFFLDGEQKKGITHELVDLGANLNAKTDISKQLIAPLIRLDVYTSLMGLPKFGVTSRTTKEERISLQRKSRKEIVRVSTQDAEDEQQSTNVGFWQKLFGR